MGYAFASMGGKGKLSNRWICIGILKSKANFFLVPQISNILTTWGHFSTIGFVPAEPDSYTYFFLAP